MNKSLKRALKTRYFKFTEDAQELREENSGRGGRPLYRTFYLSLRSN